MTFPELVRAIAKKYDLKLIVNEYSEVPKRGITSSNGVYYMQFEDGSDYIGKARCLSRRLSQHEKLRGRRLLKLTVFSLCHTPGWDAYIEEVALVQIPGSLNQESSKTCTETVTFRKRRKGESKELYKKERLRFMKKHTDQTRTRNIS